MESRAKSSNRETWRAGMWRLCSCASKSTNQFYCVCVVSGSRCGCSYWVVLWNSFSTPQVYTLYHWDGPFLVILCVFSASHLVWGRKELAVLFVAVSGEFFSLAPCVTLAELGSHFAIGIPDMTSLGLVKLA